MVGTQVLAMYYGTRNGVIVKETFGRVWVEFQMKNRTAVKAYRKADRVSTAQNVIQLGTWTVTVMKRQTCCECTATTDNYATVDVGSYGDGTRRRYHICSTCRPMSKLVTV